MESGGTVIRLFSFRSAKVSVTGGGHGLLTASIVRSGRIASAGAEFTEIFRFAGIVFRRGTIVLQGHFWGIRFNVAR